MELDEALEDGLNIDTQIEGEGMPTKRQFLEITHENGLSSALAWRNQNAQLRRRLIECGFPNLSL
jgi:hypothetical protein